MSTYTPPPFGQPDPSASGPLPPPEGQQPYFQPPQASYPAAAPYPPQAPYPAAAPYPPQTQFVPQAPSAPQAPYYSSTSAAPKRNQMVFVMSILILIGGALNLVMGFGVLAAGSLSGMSSGLYAFYTFFLLLAAVYMLVLGIFGIMNAGKPAKGAMLLSMGIICLIIPIVSIIIDMAYGLNWFSGILGFLFPILFIIGANKLKNQA